MRKNLKKIIIAILPMLLLIAPPLIKDCDAEENNQKQIPSISMGAGFSMGRYGAIHQGGDEGWDSGDGYGGGLIFESMLSRSFGIHSGIWYSQFLLSIEDEESGDPSSDPEKMQMSVKCSMITIPVYLLASLDFKPFSINLLAGFSFSYIAKTHADVKSGEDEDSADIQKFMSYNQYGLGGGIEFKYGITRFVDIFISVVGEKYLNDLISADGSSADYLYTIKLQTGILLKTF